MRDRLQAAEKESALAKVKFARKDRVFKSQRKLTAEPQPEYKFKLDRSDIYQKRGAKKLLYNLCNLESLTIMGREL